MTLLQNDVLLGRVEPSTQYVPQGRRNPQADRAVDIAGLAGLDLFDWQSGVLADAMALDDAGRWAAREVALIVTRQNGKGSILEARQVYGLVSGEALQVHSAHQFKTCYEHFRRVRDLVLGCDLLADQVEIIRTGAGDQAIEFRNGARLRFVARKGGSGRGFSADVLYLDEAFELTDETVGDLLPTLMAVPNAQVWYTSSAPHETSEALHRVRARALEGDDPRLLFLEWGNDEDVDPLDRSAWARSNPSMGFLIDPDDIAAEQRSMSAATFARERLGVPEPPVGSVSADLPIDPSRWADLTDGDSLPVDGSVRLALDAPPDRSSAVFCIAGRRDDGLTHVSVRHREAQMSADAGLLRDRVVAAAMEWTKRYGVPLSLPPGSPARAWRSELLEAGVELDELTTPEFVEAYGLLLSKVADGALRHRGQVDLDVAVAGLHTRPSGDVDVPSRRASSADVSPLIAAMCALVRVAAAGGGWIFE